MEPFYQPGPRLLFTVARHIDARFAIECLLCAPFPRWYTEDDGPGDAAERRSDSHLTKGFAALALSHEEHTQHKGDDAAEATELTKVNHQVFVRMLGSAVAPAANVSSFSSAAAKHTQGPDL